MGDRGRVRCPDDLQSHPSRIDSVEQPDAVTAQQRSDRDGGLLDQAGIEELPDRFGATTDPDVLAGGASSLLQGGLDRRDEVEHGHADVPWSTSGGDGSSPRR
jgi:hypothetical protein